MKLTPMQIIGIIIVVNGALIGSTAQLTDLLGPLIAKDIVSIASIGNSIFGGVIMMLSGQGAMVKSVLSMTGVEKIDINGQANSTLAKLAVDPTQDKISPTPAAMDKVVATAKAAAVFLFAIFVLMSAQPASAAAQRQAAPHQVCDPLNLIPGCRPDPTSTAPATTSDAPCDITILTKLTPANLVPTIKKCVSNINSTLVNDTSRALDSAKAFQPNPDQDAVNCLAPGLALFKAGVQVPGVPAVTAPDGTVTTPAVPAQDPGPILLFQKYREFTIAGGLTSCQNWVNTPVNATIAAGASAAGAVAGAAIIAPK